MECDSKEVIGKYIWDVQFDLLPLEKRTKSNYYKIKNSLQSSYTNKNASWLNINIEQQIYTKSEKKKDIITTTFIIDFDNFMTGNIIKDIIDLKHFQEKAFKKQKIESIGILADGIAHDFNNFLTIINGNLSLAKMILETQKKNNSEIIKIINEVIMASKKVQNLFYQLLTFSKMGSLKKKLLIFTDS